MQDNYRLLGKSSSSLETGLCVESQQSQKTSSFVSAAVVNLIQNWSIIDGYTLRNNQVLLVN